MSQLHREVASIEDQVEEMANLAKGMLEGGVQSLIDLDREAAEVVLGQGEALAQLDEDIEAHILRTFALQEPVAGDLRRIGTALKLITYINRIGRYGRDVAKVTTEWPEGADHVARMVNLPTMGEKVARMVDIAILAFRDGTDPDTTTLMQLEDDVDAMRYSIWREALTYMAQDPHTIERCAHYMMVGRYLERCGDNVVKMAEKLHWSATGKRILLK
ncbi:MAG: phosphate signaling complex protein PhoU [Thermoplasmatota archaeon]